jgi:beta-xylosidase
VLYLDNAPVNSAEKVQRKLYESRFRRLKHSLISPGLTRCDFFPFWHFHEKAKFLSYQSLDKLQETTVETIEAIPKTNRSKFFRHGRDD